MKRFTMRHEFVEYIPDELEEGVLYVSVKYATAAHKCCSGCGFDVVTPITPTDWVVSFNGETVSLDPSIGNWSFPCRSHYYIRENRVIWARSWTEEEITAGRARDRASKEQFFDAHQGALSNHSSNAIPKRRSIWRVLEDWFGPKR